MHVLLYEWTTGGGLVEQSAALPRSLLAEGVAMISALAADFAAIDGCRVTVLRDMRLTNLPLPLCEVVEIHSEPDWRLEFDRHAAAADFTLAVAPEFDGILQATVARAAAAGAGLLNAPPDFIALTANKHRTAERLRQAGVAAPAGRLLAADDPKLPADFSYPGVLKPIDGAGSQHMLLVEGPGDEPPPHPWPRRLESFHAGRAASAAFICGAVDRFPLPACWQRLSDDGRFTYLGGAIIREAALACRAVALAARALDALPAAYGYVGVDVVLGDASDGSEDVVIEVNPRLTTSYVGLRAAVEENLAQAILDAARGGAPALTLRHAEVQFSADGKVCVEA